MTNHFEKHHCLSTKDNLFLNLNRLCEQTKQNVFDFMPVQFVVDFSQNTFANETERFVYFFKNIEKVKRTDGLTEGQ